jgi:hypothetical protein
MRHGEFRVVREGTFARRTMAQYISAYRTDDPSLDTYVKDSYFQWKVLRTGSRLPTEESGYV